MQETKYEPIQGAQPWFGDTKHEILKEIEKALDSGVLSQGPKVEEFERAFALYSKAKFCAAVSSGGSAVELALKALDVRGKEVLVPTNTFVATGNAVTLAGGTPVFVDSDAENLCMCPEDLKRKFSQKTAAVIFVPLFGLIPPSIKEIQKFCREKNIFLIEDAAHAHGASFDGIASGEFGIAGCYSFFGTKVITTGEGGAVTTNDKDLHNKILQLRNHGKSLTSTNFELTSNNYRLSEIPAIIGISQVKLLDTILTRRNEIAKIFRKGLEGVEGIKLVPEYHGSISSYWRFPALLDKKIDRKEFQQQMWERYQVRITWMYEPLCHQQPVFRNSRSQVPLPVSEDIMQRLICLPTHGHVSDEGAARVVGGIKRLLN